MKNTKKYLLQDEISYVRDFQDCWCHCPAVSASGHQQAPIKTDIAKDKTVSLKIRKCQTFKQHHFAKVKTVSPIKIVITKDKTVSLKIKKSKTIKQHHIAKDKTICLKIRKCQTFKQHHSR